MVGQVFGERYQVQQQLGKRAGRSTLLARNLQTQKLATVPASDLYSLGATFIFQVTGYHPADLPQKDGRIQFEQAEFC